MNHESNIYLENPEFIDKDTKPEETLFPDNDIKNQKKYKYFYDKERGITNTDMVGVENAVENNKEVSREVKDKDIKSKEFLEGVSSAKDRIVNFGKKFGLDFKERFISDDKIYLLNKDDFKRFYGNQTIEGCGGICKVNEIVMSKIDDCDGNEDVKREIHNAQHELIHSVSKIKYYIEKDNNLNKITVTNFRSGYYREAFNKKEAFNLLNEGITEIINQQIFFDNGMRASETAYSRCVIFITEMIKDITRKTGESEQKILIDFQRGVFEGSNKYLKPIIETYGTEAFCKLRDLKDDDESFLKLARLFKLQSVSKNIKDLAKGEKSVKINILDYEYKILGNNK